MPVHFDNRGIDHGVFHVWVLRDGIKKPFENIGFHPVPEADIHRIPFAEARWQVPPRAAGPHDPKHGLEKTPVVLAATPRIAGLAKAMWRHFRPLGVGQYESFHPELESHQARVENPESQQPLARIAANPVQQVDKLLPRNWKPPERIPQALAA